MYITLYIYIYAQISPEKYLAEASKTLVYFNRFYNIHAEIVYKRENDNNVDDDAVAIATTTADDDNDDVIESERYYRIDVGICLVILTIAFLPAASQWPKCRARWSLCMRARYTRTISGYVLCQTRRARDSL